eukprot:CAMPEP_0119546066 /NCGR_PEP_ID=MMETSP1352-20130426/628_1 /TAXON_ID=265584 /ORGANISM="Stauroneis constricta, Strain CCMP1120" /LENGTH=331 /DNA_ID=CAMNT_0007590723 /DNA_START=44 /DNA_END=1039 /DNA_ORIENTATION=+
MPTDNTTNNNSDGKHDGIQDRKTREMMEDAAIINRFMMLARSSLHDVADMVENGNPKNISNYKLGGKEQQEILSITGMGLAEGVVAGLATFITLRRGPIMIGRFVTRRQQSSASRNSFTSSTSAPSAESSYKLSDPNARPTFDPYSANPKWPRPKSLILRSVWFCFDVTFSLMMAASVSMQLSSAERIKSKVAELPLVEGKSLASTALCGPIRDELKRLHREQSPVYRRLRDGISNNDMTSPGPVYLDGIIQFVENCERRWSMEERLRLSKGLSKHAQVDIPPPGVPKNEPRSQQWDEDHGGDDEVIDLLEDTAWADRFTNDYSNDHRESK